ncbi:hypothetical protein AA313_de0202493 [Arthrobotrys entomopaga]|nr:hypothetical protein AA313_de0202493 [Arthrobotrys entomopaga]
MKAMKGKKIVDAKQQGKYFWIVMDSPPHPLMHFGMTGWITFNQAPEAHYRAEMADDNDDDESSRKKIDWPPRFMKFELEMEGDGGDNKVAFTDPRRLGRIRLINVEADKIRKVSPLKENGPDPVVDGLDEKWFRGVLKKRKVPVKALLLDQAFISGVGNWVGDEILFHARIHPEQYTNTLSDEQEKQLFESTMYICKTACGLLGDSSKFPADWLFKYRWGKGKKGNKLPSGEKIDFVKVGGRTSAYVKTRQKATGGTAVKVEPAGSEEEEDSGEEVKKSAKKRKAIKDEEDEETPAKKGKKGPTSKGVKAEKEVVTPAKRGRKKAVKKEESEEEESEEEKEEESDWEVVEKKSARKGKSASAKKGKQEVVMNGKIEPETPTGRRSSRLKK